MQRVPKMQTAADDSAAVFFNYSKVDFALNASRKKALSRFLLDFVLFW
jgi:hypothetical protein